MNPVPFNDLRRQHAALREALAEAMGRVLDRGSFILGEEGRAFEQEFAMYCGAAHGIGVASGTEALYTALMAVGVAAGDEVVTVANTCVPTVAAIVMAGARPVLVDVDPVFRTMDPERLEAALTRRTRAIIPVHLYGQPADMPAILMVAERKAVPVIEDAAQAHGARVAGRHVGTFGAVGCFSFYPTKNLGAIGDAGMLVTSDPGIEERARLVRNYGQRERNRSVVPGINSRLDEVQAAVLRAKLPYLDAWNERRAAIAARYRQGLQGTSLKLPSSMEGTTSAHHLFVVEVSDRSRFEERCQQRGVGTAVHYPIPIHLQPAYARLGHKPGDFPVAEALCRTVVSLPQFPELTDAEIAQVIEAIWYIWG